VKPSDEQLIKLAIEYGFGCDVTPCPEYPDGVIWFDANPLEMLRAALEKYGTKEPKHGQSGKGSGDH
jgi:hypothetical protein